MFSDRSRPAKLSTMEASAMPAIAKGKSGGQERACVAVAATANGEGWPGPARRGGGARPANRSDHGQHRNTVPHALSSVPSIFPSRTPRRSSRIIAVAGRDDRWRCSGCREGWAAGMGRSQRLHRFRLWLHCSTTMSDCCFRKQ